MPASTAAPNAAYGARSIFTARQTHPKDAAESDIDKQTLKIRAVEATSSSIGDAPMSPDLLDQILPDEEVCGVTGDELTTPANATMRFQPAMPMLSFPRARMRRYWRLRTGNRRLLY
jgi:hypothetical protein